MANGFVSPLAIGVNDGPTLTAAASATCLPTSAKYTFGPNSIVQGTCLKVRAMGRISCAVTTPGTARLDLRLGGTVIFDSGALALNVVVKTTLPWWLEIVAICRTSGASGNFFGFCSLQTEAIVGSPLASAGGSGSLLSAVSGGPETAPAVGGNVDLTIANAFDMFFTQTVSTGSFTVHNMILESASIVSA